MKQQPVISCEPAVFVRLDCICFFEYINEVILWIEGCGMSESSSRINWYPGHMARSKRQLAEQIRRIDMIIEVCDARLPYSSRNPELSDFGKGKKRLLFLNKSDLADPDVSARWIEAFRREGTEAHLLNASRAKGKETVKLIDRETEDIVSKALEKGIRKTVKAMIVGIPNVGKSTLINHLYGRNISRIGDRPGVTKSSQWVKVSPYLELLDTPGLLWPRLDNQTAARRLCYIGSIKDDVIDIYELTIHLLQELCQLVPEKVMERFHIQDAGLQGIELLDAVCAGRGWLMKGNQFDYDRCCAVVLDEFRGGKLGRITLEYPESCGGA